MYICILGRQPELSVTELKAVYGEANVEQLSSDIARVDSPNFDLSILGGTIKYGQIVSEFPISKHNDKTLFIDISRKIFLHYQASWKDIDYKITLGISAYGFETSPRDVQKTGLLIKNSLKKHQVSVRLIPNSEPSLSTATSHNNKLGLSQNKVELLVIKTNKGVFVAESRGTQNISAYTKRDRDRPKRDAFIGMLPPKLAQIMINLATSGDQNLNILDPFCGTGTVLQEAALRSHNLYGTDLNPKMIDYTKANLNWLIDSHHLEGIQAQLDTADAMTHVWPYARSLDAIVCETYLGQPFSAPPSPEKLQQVVKNCNHIVTEFLTNIRQQITDSTTLCLAVPAWQDRSGNFTHLPIAGNLRSIGFKNTLARELLYHRPDQVVGRRLLVLKPVDPIKA